MKLEMAAKPTKKRLSLPFNLWKWKGRASTLGGKRSFCRDLSNDQRLNENGQETNEIRAIFSPPWASAEAAEKGRKKWNF